LLYREEERDMMPVCKDLGVGVIPWSPLAMGLLGGLNRQVRLTSFSLRHATHSPRSL
jgi:aryl-alcohol dehydrogenase-like predicted oxidoreductase